jgi:hypothetical protein
MFLGDGSSVGDDCKPLPFDEKQSRKEISAPVQRVDLLEISQARVGLERYSQLFRANITDRTAREPVGVWT